VRSYVGLAILHGCVAAAFVEALLQVWRVHAPGQRIALRFLALAAPIVLPGLLALVAPSRGTAVFAIRWALFSGARWDVVQVAGSGLAQLATTVLAGIGVLLFLRDGLPFLTDRIRRENDEEQAPASHPARPRVAALLAGLPAAGLATPPDVRVLSTPDAVLFASGLGRPALTISTGTCDRLDDDELRAAIAHELEHLRRRDPALGWVLLVMRALQCFSPAAQIVGRQIVQEIERRSDHHVAERGMAPALARAIRRLSSAGTPRTDLAPDSSVPPALAALASRAASHATEARCERLLATPPPEPARLGRLRAALTAGGLLTLLFFTI
jgi:Zn-dependent protease with chaperone function